MLSTGCPKINDPMFEPVLSTWGHLFWDTWYNRACIRKKNFFERGLKLKDLINKTTFRKEIFQNFLSGDLKSPPK